MASLPLHPALVHIPLGLAFIIPALALGFAWAIWKGRIRPRAWLVIVLLQALLLAGGLVAMNTGEREEKKVESTVPEMALEMHEAYAGQFVWTTGITLAAAGLVFAFRGRAAVRALTAITFVATLLVAGAALRVGHAGGELVYVHNAGAAYASGTEASTNAGIQAKNTPLDKARSVGDDKER